MSWLAAEETLCDLIFVVICMAQQLYDTYERKEWKYKEKKIGFSVCQFARW